MVGQYSANVGGNQFDWWFFNILSSSRGFGFLVRVIQVTVSDEIFILDITIDASAGK